jgi:hypothetical protein
MSFVQKLLFMVKSKLVLVSLIFLIYFVLGFKYLTDKNRHWSERLFWFISLLLSISFSSYFIKDAYNHWQNSPVIMNFSEKFMNIWEIPFAAVTVCPIGGLHALTENGEFKNFSGSTEQRIRNVMWRGEEVDSNDFFTEIKTAEGFCWSFNLLNYYDIFNNEM